MNMIIDGGDDMGKEIVIIRMVDGTESYSTGDLCQIDYPNDVVKGKRTDLDGTQIVPLEEFVIPWHSVVELTFRYGE